MTGVLAWGVKESLISYVSSAPGGKVYITKDVKWEDNQFRFPLREPGPDAAGGDGESYEFDGTVRLHGHFGMLVAELSALRIARGDRGWALAFADGENHVEAFTLGGEPERSGGAEDARLDWKDVRVTGAGSDLFGGHYPSGTPFDPLSVIL